MTERKNHKKRTKSHSDKQINKQKTVIPAKIKIKHAVKSFPSKFQKQLR